MGLDNGIIVRSNKADVKFSRCEWYSVEEGTWEVCYWRKYWGLRNEVMQYLQKRYEWEDEPARIDLTLEDVKIILTIVKEWKNKKRWNAESRSIWSYKEAKGNLAYTIENLIYLIAKMEDFPNDIEVYFYDSY